MDSVEVGIASLDETDIGPDLQAGGDGTDLRFEADGEALRVESPTADRRRRRGRPSRFIDSFWDRSVFVDS